MTKLTEDQMQIALVHWLEEKLPDNINWCAVCNERDSTAARGNKFKKMGLKPGWSDLQFFRNNNGKLEAYFLELKLASRMNHKNGGLSDKQIDFMDSWNRWPNVTTEVAWGFPHAREIIAGWFGISPDL